MNVVRVENTFAPTRGRGGGRSRGRVGTLAPNSTPMINLAPKYDFQTERQPLVNINPSNTNLLVTPKNTRKYLTTSSSSGPKSTLHRRDGQSSSGNRISPHSITSDLEECVIIAITSGRGDARGEVGMAAIDVQYPHMILCQISDCNTYINTLTKIHTLNPVEIIMPDTMCERSIYTNGLYQVIRERFESVTITPIARMHFHDTSGMDKIKTHCAEEFSSVELFVKQKYYALAAASALFKYVEYIQHIVYAPKSMKIDFHTSQNTTFIDIESAQCLELVASQDSGGRFSLLRSLDRCSTPMGRRLLRASILQPPCNLDLVKTRQACVAEFVTNRPFHSIVKPVVKRLYGASRLLSLAILTSQTDSVQAAEKNLNYILLLKNIVDIIPELRSVMENGQASFFQKVFEDLKDQRYQKIKELILSVIHAEAQSVIGFVPLNMQRCFAIRSGLNDMLDLARQTYCELIDDMQTYTKTLSERYKLPLSLGCNASLGYHIEMDVRQSSNFQTNDLPEELIEVHKQKGKIFMTTNILLVLSQHCRDACAELHIMSNVLLNEILTNIREHIGCLLKLSDNVGELDLVMSMAQVSSISDYVVPIFGQKLEVRDSRHPIMDISGNDSPVSNDIVATVAHNFTTITGPNMSGKSVYLKQIVLLQIMAQIGYYVPATKAEFRVADRIFCRLCSRDVIESDASTFVLEIKEAQYIIQAVTGNSLIILDELCRGTTVEEGTSIAWSICETLLRTKAFTFNATHFLYLTRLSEFYYNVKNVYFETESNVSQAINCNDSRLIYTHKLKSGIASVWNYGIALARSTGLPDTIVSLASNLADEIAKSVKPLEAENETNLRKENCYDCFVEMCGLLKQDQFTVSNLVQLVNEFKIPSVMRELAKEEMLKKRQEEDISSVLRTTQKGMKGRKERKEVEEIKGPTFHTENFEHNKIQDVELTKRLSTTSISSDSDVKKPKVCSNKDPPRPFLSPFNYLRQTKTMKSSRKESPTMSQNSEVDYENSDSVSQSENYHIERTRANLIHMEKPRSGTQQRINNRNFDESSGEPRPGVSNISITSSEIGDKNSYSMKRGGNKAMDNFHDQRVRANLMNTQKERFGTQRSNRNDYETCRKLKPEISSLSATSSEIPVKISYSVGQSGKQLMDDFHDQRARANLMNVRKERFGTQRSNRNDYESFRNPSPGISRLSPTSSEVDNENSDIVWKNEKQAMEFSDHHRARENFTNTQISKFETQRTDRKNYDESVRIPSPAHSSLSATSSQIRYKNSHLLEQSGKQPMGNLYGRRTRANLINTEEEKFGTQRSNINNYKRSLKPSPKLLSQSNTSSEFYDKNSHSLQQNEKRLMEYSNDQQPQAKRVNMQKEWLRTQRSTQNTYESSKKPSSNLLSQSSTSSEVHNENSHAIRKNETQPMEYFGAQRARANLINTLNPRFEIQKTDGRNYDESAGEPSPVCSSQSATSTEICYQNSHSIREDEKKPIKSLNDQQSCANLITTQKETIETHRTDKSDYEVFAEMSPEFIILPGTSQGHCSQALTATKYSQMSIDTYIARRTARKKEADVFRIIEGNSFDEAAFYGSLQSALEIDSDEEFV